MQSEVTRSSWQSDVDAALALGSAHAICQRLIEIRQATEAIEKLTVSDQLNPATLRAR